MTRDAYKELTAQGKDAYLQALDDIEWFSQASNSRAEIEQRLADTPETDSYVFCLYDLWFDLEGFENEESYSWLLQQIMELIGLQEALLFVDYEEESNSVLIQLETSTNKYSYLIYMDDSEDWVDANVIDEFVNNQILPNEGASGRLLPLPSIDQNAQFVFVSEQLYDQAIERGIIPPNTSYFMDNAPCQDEER